jgi:hypothetical protein
MYWDEQLVLGNGMTNIREGKERGKRGENIPQAEHMHVP